VFPHAEAQSQDVAWLWPWPNSTSWAPTWGCDCLGAPVRPCAAFLVTGLDRRLPVPRAAEHAQAGGDHLAGRVLPHRRCVRPPFTAQRSTPGEHALQSLAIHYPRAKEATQRLFLACMECRLNNCLVWRERGSSVSKWLMRRCIVGSLVCLPCWC
jgi:hypothetical protein